MFDAVSFCEDYGISYGTEGSKNIGKNHIGVDCVFCGDHNHHGSFNLLTGYYSCWKCGRHPIWEVVKALTGEKNPKKIIEQYQIYGTSYEENKRQTLQGVDSIEIPGKPLTKLGRTYLERRNFDPDYIIGKYGVKEGEALGKYAHRLIIPIKFQGKNVSFQTRRMLKLDPLRYKNCPIENEAVHMKDLLYNLDNTKKRRAIAAEGVALVWKIGDDSFSTFGTNFTIPQLTLIKNYFDEVFWLFDPEKMAQKKAETAAQLISSVGVKTEIVGIEGYSDYDKLTENDIIYIKKEFHLY